MEDGEGLTMLRRISARWCNPLLAAGVLCVTLTVGTARSGHSEPDAAVSKAREAIACIEQGDHQKAATRIREGLQVVPSSPLLHNLAGAVLLLTGDRAGSEASWRAARRIAPESGIAAYGMALTSLAQGDLDQAEAHLEEASQNGDVGVCLLARQYIAYLRGSRAASSLALPSQLDAGRLGLEAAHAAARGDASVAAERAARALSDPTTARYAEPNGALMTFERARPLSSGAPSLPRGLLTPKSGRRPQPVSGPAILRSHIEGAAYAAFKVDGRLVSVVNSPPFTLTWDTATVHNGPHVVEILAYDRHGRELHTSRSELLTSNASAPIAAEDRAIEDLLWNRLALRPSRASVALLAARAASLSDDRAGARKWTNLAAAIDPAALRAGDERQIIRQAPAYPAVWGGSKDEKLVALTFDDGPRPGITEELLDILAREQAPATFFVVGRYAALSPHLIVRLAQAGMEIANHSFTHPNLSRLSPDEIRRELLRTSACIQDAVGFAPVWFRPPGGNLSERVSSVAAALGMRACMWTVNAEQKELEGSDAVVTHVLGGVRPGAIVLLHNGRRPTVAALPRLIAELRRRGFRLVTVSDLMERARSTQARPVLQ